jgi:hypothetical protein
MSQSAKRTYRWLGALALAHGLLVSLLIIFFFDAFHRSSLAPLWFALATLWFLWPVVLILHRGRSWKRCLIFLSLSAFFFLPSLPDYALHNGPWVVGLPFGVDLEPISISRYSLAWWAGRTEAEKDVAKGILAREVYGFGAGGGHAAKILRERYHIETRPVADCIVDEKIVGHATGYNEISEKEIDRRVGLARVKAAEAEGFLLDRQTTARREQYWRDLARRFSIFPGDSNVILRSVTVFGKPPYTDFNPLEPALEKQLGNVVREIEKFVKNAIPKQSAAFELRVRALLAPARPTDYEVGSSRDCPREIYDRIWRGLPEHVLPPWQGDELSVSLEFVIHAKSA